MGALYEVQAPYTECHQEGVRDMEQRSRVKINKSNELGERGVVLEKDHKNPGAAWEAKMILCCSRVATSSLCTPPPREYA